MKYLMICAAAVFAVVATSASRGEAATDTNQCLRQREVLSFHALNDHTLIVEVIGHQKFKVNTQGVCSNLTYKDGVAFRTFERSQLACLTRGDTVVSREFGDSSGIGNRCTVASVEPYTPAMEHADKVEGTARSTH